MENENAAIYWLFEMFKFVVEYRVTKGLDKISSEKSISANEQLFADLIESLDNSLKVTCNKFEWEYDSSAIEETIVDSMELWINCTTGNDLRNIFSNVLGTELSDEQFLFWNDSFEKEVAVHNSLFNYLQSKCQHMTNNYGTSTNLKQKIWTASQISYKNSRNEGNRFYSLNILKQLLPDGYIEETQFITQAKSRDGNIIPIMDIYLESNNNIAIVGNGGIGKTTFLQQILENTFETTDSNLETTSVPIFIELNRCPQHILDWYDDALRKTNFITRYIAQLIEKHSSLNSVSIQTLDEIEKEFQRYPEDNIPEYVLLLDGFNEVKSDTEFRQVLSNEIAMLSKYPNVRIVTTSRETHAAYFAIDFETIRVVGINQETILSHLAECEFNDIMIGNIKACKPLMECLSTPLYLCMFTAQKTEYQYLPETAGEILHRFFHENSDFYNVKERFINSQILDFKKNQIDFIIDFIIPYIGWVYETQNVFYMNEQDFIRTIESAFFCVNKLFIDNIKCPFSNFDYKTQDIKKAAESFMLSENEINIDRVIAGIYNHLGIVYQYTINEGDYNNRRRYSFCHHNFRDYFSAMWDIQLLIMLQCIDFSFYQHNSHDFGVYSFNGFLNTHFWNAQKIQFISEILMEHRNKPQYNDKTQKWYLPKMNNDRQKVLSATIDFCRELCAKNIEVYHLLQNILSTVLHGRKELSGVNLSRLDLRKCSFFNVNCSKMGEKGFLAVNFDGASLYKENFEPENHKDNVIEFVYKGEKCFTIDGYGLIKCWDVHSGKLEYELYSDEPASDYDFSNKGFLKISNCQKWLITKTHTHEDRGIYLFDLDEPYEMPYVFKMDAFKQINYIGFTEDSQNIIVICDEKNVIILDIQEKNIVYNFNVELNKNTELYAQDISSPMYAFSSDYNPYITDGQFVDGYDDLSDEDEYIEVFCEISSIDFQTKEKEKLLEFFSEPGTHPTFTYIPHRTAFVYYNFETKNMELFDCVGRVVEVIIENAPSLINIEHNDYLESPKAIHPNPNNKNECYVMYDTTCYEVNINNRNTNNIIMEFSVEGIKKLLENSEDVSNGTNTSIDEKSAGNNETNINIKSALMFKTNVIPTNNCFIISNDTNTYEWNSENDTIILKYNCAYYETIALTLLNSPNTFALVHMTNGISIFEGNPARLNRHICFNEPEYFIGNCSYDKGNNIMGITFARPEHEKVVLVNLNNDMMIDIFSTLHTNESVETICFNDSGTHLLITTQYQCLEYDVAKQKYFVVTKAGDNERLGGGAYKKNEIEVAIVEDFLQEGSSVDTRCEYYSRNLDGQMYNYVKEWYYTIPLLDTKLYSRFIYSNGDLGISGAKNREGIQTYWLTKGFFIEENEEISEMLNLQCYKRKNGKYINTTHKLKPLDFVYVKHEHPLANNYMTQYVTGTSFGRYSYMYLSEDFTDALITDSNEKLIYIDNLKNIKYSNIDQISSRKIGDCGGNAYWNYAIPYTQSTLIGCYESYNLVSIDLKTGEILHNIEYYPGVSIKRCSFANTKMDLDVKKIIENNNT